MQDGPLRSALFAAATVFGAMWTFLEASAWFGVSPTPTPLLRAAFLAIVFGSAAIAYAAKRPSDTIPSLNLTQPEGAPQPEHLVKVLVKPGFVSHPRFGTRPTITVTIQNHSGQPVFLSQLSLSCGPDRVFTVLKDFATGSNLRSA